jgi:hypothetical protein
VGKTTAGRHVARRLGWKHVELDELRKGLHDPAQRLLGESPDRWQRSPSDLRDALVATGDALEEQLKAIIASLLTLGKSFVLEGEGIQPPLVEGYRDDPRVRSAYVVELSRHRLNGTLLERDPGRFGRLSRAERRTVVEMNVLYGLWLTHQAATLGHPCVTSKPWATLADRLTAVSGLAANVDQVDAILRELRNQGLRHALDPYIPPRLRRWLLTVPWSTNRLWVLDLAARPEPVANLRWALDLPWWRIGATGWFQLTPARVLESPASFPEHVDRMSSADLRQPLHVVRRRGRCVVLDGMHRLAQAARVGHEVIPVKELQPFDLLRIIERPGRLDGLDNSGPSAPEANPTFVTSHKPPSRASSGN